MSADEDKYIRDYVQYSKLFAEGGKGNFEIKEENIFPCLTDYRNNAGDIDFHYFPMDILVSSLIAQSKVKEHFDIGSRIDGFISHLLVSEIEVTQMDIRPLMDIDLGCGISRLRFIQADCTNLDGIDDNSIYSLSSLHAIEHFGLGRYGDNVEPNAWISALKSLQRVLAVKGKLYLAVPISNYERVCFNAHRVFNPNTIVSNLDQLSLVDFYYIQNMKINQVCINEIDKCIQQLSGYDCGVFVFTKE